MMLKDVLMWIFVIGCGVIFLGGLLALAASKRNRAASTIATVAVWIGCGIAVYPTAVVLGGTSVLPLVYDWYLPFGEINIALDGLSAFFMLPILILGPLTAMYGKEYMSKKKGLGPHYFFFNSLVVSMMMLLVAKDGILFLSAWEAMAISSFFLVVFDSASQTVRDAGWTYLVATHLGTAALLIFFAVLGGHAGSFAFDRFTSAAAFSPSVATVLFGLAVFGFGSKAGFYPLHVWLPEAHPAAPSHVSALMSGVMIKMGIYGLVRALGFLGPPPAIWGWTLIVIGLASGILGVVSALAQHNLKRLLAYHSVENIGIIALGLGAGLLGLTWHAPVSAACGFAGGLLHVLNHSIFKGLLFLSAGAALHQTKTAEMDRMGGLGKFMPWTGGSFLIGAAAICALPPLNGFVSEFLIYLAGINGVSVGTNQAVVLSAGLFAGSALIGGLAVACFTKCYGLVFLGEPREPHVKPVKEVGGLMIGPMAVLSCLCLLIGLAAPQVIYLLTPGLEVVMGGSLNPSALLHQEADLVLRWTAVAAAAFIVVVTMVRMVRNSLLRRRSVTVQGVWDCGYASPSARMQYTTSSFAQPLTDLFYSVLRTKKKGAAVDGYFPKEASFSSAAKDSARDGLFVPLFQFIAKCLAPFRVLQHGRVHIYVIYVALTLITLLMLTSGD